MRNTREDLILLCSLYARHTRRSVGTVSRLATGSGVTIQRLQAGADITTGRADRAFSYLADHWPPGLSWPDDIPRPEPAPRERAA